MLTQSLRFYLFTLKTMAQNWKYNFFGKMQNQTNSSVYHVNFSVLLQILTFIKKRIISGKFHPSSLN
jgi:hypothetical protein